MSHSHPARFALLLLLSATAACSGASPASLSGVHGPDAADGAPTADATSESSLGDASDKDTAAGDALGEGHRPDTLDASTAADAAESGSPHDAAPSCPASSKVYVVDAVNGVAGNPGTAAAPMKTITEAAKRATNCQTISVLPGTYDAANGEVFPIVLAAGVLLFGDEPNKGNGANPVLVTAALPLDAGAFEAVIEPGAASTVAGLRLAQTSSGPNAAVDVQSDGVTLRNNTFMSSMGAKNSGILVSSSNGLYLQNVIENNDIGIFIDSGAHNRFEGNIVRGNRFGIEISEGQVDLGGGDAASAGGNVLACNALWDLSTVNAVTVWANDDAWDHGAPTVACQSGSDICSRDVSALIQVKNATVAANNCP